MKVNLVITASGNRNEIQIDQEMVEGDLSRLLSFLREENISVPSSPTLTKTGDKYFLMEEPELG